MSTKDRFTPTGYCKTAYDHSISFNNLIKSWKEYWKHGLNICQVIQSQRLYENTDKLYPENVEKIINNLVEIVNSMQNITKNMNTISNQLIALNKLNNMKPNAENVFDISAVSLCGEKITKGFHDETVVKEHVLEKIAHCKDESLTASFSIKWEYSVNIPEDFISMLCKIVDMEDVWNVLR